MSGDRSVIFFFDANSQLSESHAYGQGYVKVWMKLPSHCQARKTSPKTGDLEPF